MSNLWIIEGKTNRVCCPERRGVPGRPWARLSWSGRWTAACRTRWQRTGRSPRAFRPQPLWGPSTKLKINCNCFDGFTFLSLKQNYKTMMIKWCALLRWADSTKESKWKWIKENENKWKPIKNDIKWKLMKTNKKIKSNELMKKNENEWKKIKTKKNE